MHSMEPAGYRIGYEVDGVRTTVERTGFGAFECADLAFDLRVSSESDYDIIETRLTAKVPMLVTECVISFARDFSREGILMNGYQSWTTTCERTVRSILPGIGHVPDAVKERYVLDGGGDYRFVEYDGRPGYLHGFTYAVFSRSDEITLVASLDESHGFTIIRTNPKKKTVTLDPECPARELGAGETVQLGRWAIIEMRGGSSQMRAYDRWFELMGVRARPVRPLVGYTSWYRHYDDIDAAKMLEDLSGALTAFSDDDVAQACRDTDATRLFQIDDGWCTVGDWALPHADRFPDGLAPLARDIASAGFVPGLWMAPFVCSKESRLFAEHPDWLLRSTGEGDDAGKPIMTGSHWEGAFALDTLNPEVRAYATRVIRTAVEEWGFGLLKLDFLYAVCMEPHGGMNRGELMADGMALVREAAGDALILACGVPLASAFGIADYCRVGCDVGLDWDDTPLMRMLHRERVSTKWSLIDAQARSPLDGRAFGNDPDVVFFRSDVKLTKGQRSEMYDTAAKCGSVLLTSDDMGSFTSEQRVRFTEILRSIGQRIQR